VTAVAYVAGELVSESEVDDRERLLRTGRLASALPQRDTSEGRQLRRWLAQLLVTERVIAFEAAARGLGAADAPAAGELMPDTVARMELGSIAAELLREPLARNLFQAVTADVVVPQRAIHDYHRRHPGRFADTVRGPDGWRRTVAAAPLDEVRAPLEAHLLAAARRRAFRRWLDERCAELVALQPGYEHPGDPRQPDNTHRH
jgi:[acyl-carrier-protein] S-malonyltransferase